MRKGLPGSDRPGTPGREIFIGMVGRGQDMREDMGDGPLTRGIVGRHGLVRRAEASLTAGTEK